MSHAALTAKYRPQTFAQVAGQETVKSILSRAALEQRVAPAYLFSGTRGVGKTTLARIFAKALNCRTAPTAEPCNVCDQCRAIAAGSAVDVVEIDGASNRGIDDVRRLKEVVGYAAMEGGYKIFIIDEAHMLSREAFNALLKTLEEPPARVTFLLATTEPHKFPATIISRCQHYVFKPLPESGLADHLADVLARENVSFEDSAVRLIARRGAGSVRDSMSLLGQVLALGEGTLTEATTRSVLGLAGQEAFLGLLEAFAAGDSLTLSALLRRMLDQGLDIGFFLRELAALWRNLFMLRQSDEAALAVVDLPVNEARRYLDLSRLFSLQHIHACWQMTLEGQRRVLTSLEPALALELLLLNLGMLPQLVSLESISASGRRGGRPAPGNAGPGNVGSVGSVGSGPGSATPSRASGRPVSAGPALLPAFASGPAGSGCSEEDRENNAPEYDEAAVQSALNELSQQESAVPELAFREVECDEAPAPDDRFTASGISVVEPENEPTASARPDDSAPLPENEEQTPPAAGAALFPEVPEPGMPPAGASPSPSGTVAFPEWDGIFALCEEREHPAWLVSLLRRLSARQEEGGVVLVVPDEFTLTRLKEPDAVSRLEPLFRSWCGSVPRLELASPGVRRKSRDDLKAEVMEHPLVKEVQTHFGAYVVDYGQFR